MGLLPGSGAAVGEHRGARGELRVRGARAPAGRRRLGLAHLDARARVPRRAGPRMVEPVRLGAGGGHDAVQLVRVAVHRGPCRAPRGRASRAGRRGRVPDGPRAAGALDSRRGDLLALHGCLVGGAVRPSRFLEMSVEATTTRVASPSRGLAGLWEGGVNPYGIPYKKMGMWLFILSDSLTFGAAVMCYAYLRFSSADW